MSRLKNPWYQLVALGAFSLLGACAETGQQAVASSPPPHAVPSNPPPVAPGARALWYHVNFETGSAVLDGNGQRVVSDVMASLQRNPESIATIIGKTDTVGGSDYNMRLSHKRADAVRDSLVYNSGMAADRVETRWTGEERQHTPTGNEVPVAANRVVDIAIH